MKIVRGIYRYPIKGLSAEHLQGVVLEAGKPFPFDRVFALTRPREAPASRAESVTGEQAPAGVDPDRPRWAKKGHFLMLMLDEALATVRTYVDPDTLRLTVTALDGGSAPLLTAELRDAEGRAAAEAFFRGLLPGLPGAPRLVHLPDGHFMDKPDSVLSCINLATLRSLEEAWGTPVHPLRFRANFYIDGVPPWEELQWVGRELVLGDVRFRVDRPNGRCGATNVNPTTGVRDLDLPGALRAAFGHKDLGVYLVAETSGRVVVGDTVVTPTLAAPAPTPTPASAPAAVAAGGTYICRGCYYVYTEASGAGDAAPGTPFSSLGPAWRCPDCGATKDAFRPHEGPPA